MASVIHCQEVEIDNPDIETGASKFFDDGRQGGRSDGGFQSGQQASDGQCCDDGPEADAFLDARSLYGVCIVVGQVAVANGLLHGLDAIARQSSDRLGSESMKS